MDEARKARYLSYFLKDRPREEVKQTVARWQAGMEKAQRVGTYESDYAKVRGVTPDEPVQVAHELPPIIKRTNTARVDSMIARLKDLPPALLEAKLQEIAGEFWRIGMPVNGEDLKRVAVQYLNKGDTKNKPGGINGLAPRG